MKISLIQLFRPITLTNLIALVFCASQFQHGYESKLSNVKWLIKSILKIYKPLVKIQSPVFLLHTVASYSRRAPATCDVIVGVLWTFYRCGSPAFASIVCITRPRSELVVPILHRRAAWEESIRRLGGRYCKSVSTVSFVWICLCTPFTINRTISFLYQSISVTSYK